MTQQTPQYSTASDLSSDPIRWRILAVLLMAIFMSLMSVSVVNVALASIQDALHASLSDIQWVLSGYALTFGVVLVSAGRAGDLMGRGGIFILGAVIFTLASIAAGLAPDAQWLNGARFVQGVGSGFMNPQAVGMIQQYFRGPERGRAFGFFGTTVGVSVAIGPVVGGLLIQLGGLEIGWRLTFLINVPVGVLIIVLALLWFPRPLIHKPKSLEHKGLSSLDPIGALLLGLGVLAVLYPFVGSDSTGLIWLLLPAGLLLFYLWARWERWYTQRGYSPMVDLKIFAISSYRNGSIIMSLYFLGMTSVWVLIPLYVQQGLGFSAFEAGMVGIPSALLSAYSANWAGKRVNRYGRKIVIGGLSFAVFGMLSTIAVVFLHEYLDLSIWWLLLSLAFFGLGQGSVVSPNQALTLAEVPLSYAGSSGAIMQTGQRIGTSVGIAVITAIVFAVLPHSSWSIAVSVGLLAVTLVILSALAMAIKDLRDRRVL
ncbi:MAG TPA: MFS transporter [Thiopseudomonas sp.]|nr:MFS transporter [Thiopseudomonas sp.]